MSDNNGVDGGSLFNVINDARAEQKQAKLDLAVQQAQDLADKWPNGVPNNGYALTTFDRLLDLFRAAR